MARWDDRTTRRRDTGATRVGVALDAVLKRVDPEEHLRVYGVWSFWTEEVGDLIARRARPAYFRNGVLVVTVATHAWMQELRFLKESMRQRLNGRLGADLIRDLHFVAGPLDSASADRAPPPDATPLGRSLVSVPAIGDPELAAAFARILEARAQRLARARAARRR